MKVIDLLNKIANGEEVPKKICYEEYIWTWNGETYDNKKECLFEDYIDKKYVITDVLNDEIEIIEEDKEIEELNLMFPICDDIKNAELGGFASIYKSNLINIKYKFDELIKEVNKIKKG